MRYRLQRKEAYTTPNILGNRSFPVHTYRWKDIAASDDRAALEKLMPNSRDYRIEDTRPNEIAQKEDHRMDYHGFRSVKEYENECARIGFTTRRVPFHKDGEPYFALITTPPSHPTGTSIESWTLFTADETAQVLDGVINGHDVNYLGKLSAHGYHPCKLQDAPAPAPAEPEYPVGEGGQICFLF